MPKSKFKGKVQSRPKLNSYTLVTSNAKGDVSYEQVKAIDVDGAKALAENGQTLLNVLKGHPELVA